MQALKKSLAAYDSKKDGKVTLNVWSYLTRYLLDIYAHFKRSL